MQKNYYHRIGKGSIAIILLFAVLVPTITPAQTLEVPQTVDEAKEFGTGILKQLPDEMKKIFDAEVEPLWGKMWAFVVDFWNRTGRSYIQNVIDKVAEFLGKEVEKRKPFIKEEFDKEKEELAQELKERSEGVSGDLWNRLWGIIFDRDAKEEM